MPSPLQPELFALLGIDLFLAVSLLVCLLDKHFPWQLPYLYQIAALAGFGQLMVSREFLLVFDEYMRFWYSAIYMVVALGNIVAVNVYLAIAKKLVTYAKALTFGFTLPAFTLAVFFVSNYAGVASHPLVIVPPMSWEATFIAIVAFDTFVVGLGTYIFFKPKWWYVALGAGTAITGASVYAFLKPSWGEAAFLSSAIALGVACVLVLGVSVYVLARIWVDALKERRRRKEVKQ